MHISHLSDITDEQINELLGAIVDVENLFMSMQREDDLDTKKVYYYLFRVRMFASFKTMIYNRSCFSCSVNASCHANKLLFVAPWVIHHLKVPQFAKQSQTSFSTSKI